MMPDQREMVDALASIDTEQRDSASADLDQLDARGIVQLMNADDARVAAAVGAAAAEIARAVDAAAAAINNGHRIIYMGAGTSGRLGVLDASECPPTFGTEPGQVVGLIAGGEAAMFRSQEGAEDDAGGGRRDLEGIGLITGDLVIGLAASGRTPYVLGALAHARSTGCTTVAITCSKNSPAGAAADIAVELSPGPEVLTGSTRLKAGTAQKMVLNMISTGAMVLNGKCYGNLMVDVQATNEKLRARAITIVMQATGAGYDKASAALEAASGHAKTAILSLLLDIPASKAAERLRMVGGHLGKAL